MEPRLAKDVLVVDDDDELRTLICTVLQNAGLSCDTTDHGRGALEHMRRTDYAVVLLDLVMPQLDGVQVLHEFDAWGRAQHRKPVVLIMTGMPERDWPPVPGEVAQAILRKPLDLAEMAALVVGCVQARQAIAPLPLREATP